MKKPNINLVNFIKGAPYSLLLSGLGFIMILCLARMAGLIEVAELKTLDLLMRLRSAEEVDDRITIVEITDEDIVDLQAYPVPDAVITELLLKLKSHNPRAIGLDIFRDIPVPDPTKSIEVNQDDRNELINLLQASPEIVVIEKIIDSPVESPDGVPPDHVGFADALLDDDGFVRRSLLASESLFDGKYHLSLTIQLALRYLASEGISLENGLRDYNAMRFGDTELFRVDDNFGGYVNQDTKNNPVILINFRSGEMPFNKINFSDFMSGNFSDDLINDRVILISMAGASTKDYLNTAAIKSENPGLVLGVELQAHAVSQIISAVLDNRPILKTWSTGWEYVWIIVGGICGIALISLRRSFLLSIFIVSGLSLLIIFLSYGLLILGFWVPVLPIWLAFSLNGGSAVLYRVYQREQFWHVRLNERQRIISQSYNAIHNGPLQSLKSLIRSVKSETEIPPAQELCDKLSDIDEQLRDIYEFMLQEYSTLDTRVYLNPNQTVDLEEPLHVLLHQVYRNKLTVSSQYFSGIKIKMPDFGTLNAKALNSEDKEDIVRFLQEALCNVEQHAVDVTRLIVICQEESGDNIVKVIDNGMSTGNLSLDSENHQGRGSRQALALASRLGGHFSRRANQPQGCICELRWPVRRPIFWKVWWQWLQTNGKWQYQKRV